MPGYATGHTLKLYRYLWYSVDTGNPIDIEQKRLLHFRAEISK